MSDINIAIVTGVVQKIESSQNGWSTVTVKSVKETQSKTDEFLIQIVAWKDKVTVVEGDYISANCYISSKKIDRKYGKGSFLSMQIIALNIQTLFNNYNKSNTNNSDKNMDSDDFSDCPF